MNESENLQDAVTNNINENSVPISIENFYKFINSHRLEFDTKTKLGIGLVVDEINALRNINGLEPIKHDSSQVCFLANEDFDYIYNAWLGTKGDTAVNASYLPEVGVIIVKKRDVPSYITLSVVYHEMIHKYIDAQVWLKEKINGEEVTNLVRGGLRILKPIFLGTNAQPIYYGDLLNELGNYGQENKFIKKLLGLDDFSEEALERLKILQNIGAEQYATVTFQDNTKIVFNSENIHFNLNGEALPFTSERIMMQIVTEFRMLIPQISGLSFDDALIRAKTDPRFQKELLLAFDNIFGKGFYNKLKKLPVTANEVGKLLKLLQLINLRSSNS